MKRPLLFPALALLIAALACAGGAPSGDDLPTVSFSTATPGGRISISLLSPTPTSDVNAPGGELIGPVATQTAAYATAVAQTATAAVPTPTIPGILTEQATCPEPDTPALPLSPPGFNRYAEIMVQYLSLGGPPTILEATLRNWGAITDFGGLVRADRDFTADGVPETLVLVFDPAQIEEDPRPGNLFMFGCEDESYRLLYEAGTAADTSAPALHSADDLTADFVNDLVYSTQTCEGKICRTNVEIIGWNITLGAFDTLIDREINEPFANVIVSDTDEDGLLDVSVTSGVIEDIEAGPQRTVTTIYIWDGTSFVTSEVIRSEVEYRIHLIHDGDAAMRTGDYLGAIGFFADAQDDDLLSWQYPNEDLYLRAYARYRTMLAQTLRGDVAGAQQTHDELVAAFAPPNPEPPPDSEEGPPPPTSTPAFGGLQPGIDFARMADFFWAEFSVNRDVEAACDIVVGYATASPQSYAVLNSFGYANPQYTADDMCPFPIELDEDEAP